MARTRPKKSTSHIQARHRNKVEKKVREHNIKIGNLAKNIPKKTLLNIPNSCPFKEETLKEAAEIKRRIEEEKQKLRDEAREARKAKLSGGLESLVLTAQAKQNQHELNNNPEAGNSTLLKGEIREENSLKAYYKEFKKVVDSADVVLEIVDARDPLGTRCKHVEEAVRSAKGNKKLVLVLNKADLVPRDNLDQWLKYLRSSLPTVAFKSSTQDQSKKLGRKKLGMKNQSMIQSGSCFGAELLLSLLGNYCRSGDGIKSSIRVGIVGLPNVGKSSVINSLKRSKACNVGNQPGVTRAMQIVQLDSKVKLLDSPGIVFADNKDDNDSCAALKNAVKIQSLKDPYTPARAIFGRVEKQKLIQLYGVNDFTTFDEFLAGKALRFGMFKKGGIPDMIAAARSLINDWNSGKIRYYTVPPEIVDNQVSATIVMKNSEEFDIEKFNAEEQMMLDSVAEESAKVQSAGEVSDTESIVPAEISKKKEFKLQKINEKQQKKVEAKKANVRKKKVDPMSEIEGNQKLNKLNKLQFKKQKKQHSRREKEASKLADQLNGFDLDGAGEDYNSDTDVKMEDK